MIGKDESIRLQVYLARSGVASRRKSEDLIRAGRVRVNGSVSRELGVKVSSTDRVEVDGEPVDPDPTCWVALHKPSGYVTTRDDRWGRRTVFDLLPPDLHTLFHVGRLDRDSEGLLLLTNEGELANRLMHPRYGITKEYIVWMDEEPDDDALATLVRGVELEDGLARAKVAEVLRREGARWLVRVVLGEGKKREVRRMFDHLGHPVRRLVRRRFGPLDLGRLEPGEWRRLTPAEVGSLRTATRTRTRKD